MSSRPKQKAVSSRWRHNQKWAEYGEKLAWRHLKKRGYRLLAKRFWTRFGEIDLVLQKKSILSFVEVKTRCQSKFGHPLEAITTHKIQRLTRASMLFLQQRKYPLEKYQLEYLAVAVQLEGKKPIVECVPIFL